MTNLYTVMFWIACAAVSMAGLRAGYELPAFLRRCSQDGTWSVDPAATLVRRAFAVGVLISLLVFLAIVVLFLFH